MLYYSCVLLHQSPTRSLKSVELANNIRDNLGSVGRFIDGMIERTCWFLCELIFPASFASTNAIPSSSPSPESPKTTKCFLSVRRSPTSPTGSSVRPLGSGFDRSAPPAEALALSACGELGPPAHRGGRAQGVQRVWGSQGGASCHARR